MLMTGPRSSRFLNQKTSWLSILLRGRSRKNKMAVSSQMRTEVLEERALLTHTMPEIHTLFAEGTPDSVVAKYEHDHDEEETPIGEFNADDRWGSTASDGGGLGQGDPTTLTWSIAADGTDIPGFNGEDAAPSNLVATLASIYGTNTDNGDHTDEPWFDEIQRALDRWSAISGLNYVYEPNDDGAAFSSFSNAAPGVVGVRGDVRIGGHEIDGDFGVLGYNFFPDNGEMVLDTADAFYSNTSNDSIRLRNVLAHEAGHGLGIGHVESDDARFLMEPFLSTAFDGPQLDDILAAHRNFGDANEFSNGNETTETATSLGTIGDGVTVSIGTDAGDTVVALTDNDFVSIDDDGDTDVFSFTVAADASVSLSLSPVGPTYNQGRQDGTQSPYNASAQSDLTLELLGTNGAVVASANANGIGSGESITDFDLGTAGTYFARITGATNNVVQVYSLDVSVTIDTAPPDVSITATDASKSEGDSGSTDYTFTVTRVGDTSGSATVDYAVSGNGASAASANDFTGGAFPAGTVTFGAGEVTQTITISVAGDSDVENDEGFTVTLSNPSGTLIDNESASGSILNDDTSVSIAQADASKAEGDSGTTEFTFTVSRTGDLSSAGNVTYTVSGNGATADDFADGVFETGTVSFAAGEDSQTVTIDVAGDLDVEADEGFTVTLSNATGGASIAMAAASGTIRNDDADLSITADDATKSEGDSGSTAFTFTVTRSGTEGSRTVDWAVTGSGANPADASDFAGGAFPNGTVSFSDGEATATITVNVAGDSDIEPDEDFTVTLSNASGNAEISGATASSTIDNDDVQIDIAILTDDADKAEGNSGTTSFTFLVTRTGDTSGISTVDFDVAGATTNGASASDFDGNALPSGTVTFNPNDTQATITVLVAGDTVVESDEGFTVMLSDAVNAEIVTASASGTIRNDDTILTIAPVDGSLEEGDSGETTTFRFTVTRSGNTDGATDVNFAVSGDADVDDFGGTLPSGTVSFVAGETSKEIQIDVIGDNADEENEEFTVTLSGATNGATITTATADSTIVNDDFPPATYGISAANATRNEATGSFSFTVTRSGGDPDSASAVDFTVAGSGANSADADDFGGTLPSGTVNFAAGETAATLTINVSNDADIEADETFTVTLTEGGASADGTILNDDPEPESGVRLENGVLIITGTNASEFIRLHGSQNGISVFVYNFATRERIRERFRQSDVVSIAVDAKGGDDRVYLNGQITQDSVIELGAGIDRAYGGRGSDVINGGADRDFLFGGDGDDVINGGDDTDLIRGGNGNDLLRGGDGINFVFGDRGNDILVGGTQFDYLNGGGGRDILIGGGSGDRLDGRGGDDILVGASTAYDNDDAALNALMTEWSSTSIGYTARVENIRTGGGSLNGIKLDSTTVTDDNVRDTLIGRRGRDFFVADFDGSDRDRVFRSRSELFEALP